MSALGQVLKRSWPALLAHWVMTIYGVACFVTSIVRLGDRAILNSTLAVFLASFVVGVIFWQLVGNVFGLLRLRFGILAIVWLGIFALTVLVGSMAPMLSLGVVIGLFSFPAGALALRGRAEIFGAWPPLAYAVWGAVVWINFTGKVSTWKSGAKYAVWDAYTIGILGGAVLLFLMFLVFRHALALTWWQEEAQPLEWRGGKGLQKNPARPGIAGLGCVVVVAALLATATLGIAPFLFRTAPAENGDGEDKPEKPEHKPPEEEVDPMEPKLPDADMEAMVEVIEKAVRTGAKVAKKTLPWLILALLFYAIGARPLRRLLLVRHLERPLWRVSPTRKIHNLWIRALIALDDLGVRARQDETPVDVAARANAAFRESFGESAPGLDEAASIYQTVEFAGRGIQAHEAQGMELMVLKLGRWASERATLGQKIAAGYRGRMRRPR